MEFVIVQKGVSPALDRVVDPRDGGIAHRYILEMQISGHTPGITGASEFEAFASPVAMEVEGGDDPRHFIKRKVITSERARRYDLESHGCVDARDTNWYQEMQAGKGPGPNGKLNEGGSDYERGNQDGQRESDGLKFGEHRDSII